MLKRDPLPVYTGQAKNMLILDMGSASESSTALLTQIVVNDNDFRSRFNVIDRETINALLKDQQLASVGIINESTVARLGKQSGVQVLLKSNLNYLETASNTGGTAKSGYYTYYTAKAQVALSVLDVETGQILVTATGTGGSSDRSNDSSLRTEAFTEAVENAIYSLILSHSKLR
jgi:curli biogenesis system outer membrane secretion channel CsgG